MSTSRRQFIAGTLAASAAIPFAPQASYRVTGPAVQMGEGVVRRIFA